MTDDRQQAWLGIDLGTQSVRVVAVDGSGHVLSQASRPLTGRRDRGRHEQDPEQWWTAVCAATRETLAGAPRAQVQGVAVDATSGTVVLVDADGTPVTPALMYDDRRAADHLDRVNEVGADLWSALGYVRMQAVWGLPKALWLFATDAARDPGTRLLHQADLINERLCGHRVPTDPSTALKTGVDLLRTQWPQDVLADLGLDVDRFPSVCAPATVLGTVGAEASEQTGLPPGTPVVAGLTDGCASQLGAGCVAPGSWNSVLGTTLVLKGVTQDLLRDPTGAVYSHRSPGGGWLPGGASSVGAGRLTEQFAGRDLDALGALAARRSPTGVLLYPLTGVGERFPFVAPTAEAFTVGVPGDDVEAFAAVMQGVAFVERLAYEHLSSLGAPVGGQVVATGGGARSAVWNQLRADVLGRPLALPLAGDSAMGMAVLAACVTTDRPLAQTAAEMVRVGEIVEPDAGTREVFDDLYGRFVTELLSRGWLDAPPVAGVGRHD